MKRYFPVSSSKIIWSTKIVPRLTQTLINALAREAKRGIFSPRVALEEPSISALARDFEIPRATSPREVRTLM